MPDVKVYIRAENLEKWNSIASKSDWINTLLKNADDTSRWGKTIETPVGPSTVVLTETVPEQLYAVVAGDEGYVKKDKLTYEAAQKWLEMQNDPDGELRIIEMK